MSVFFTSDWHFNHDKEFIWKKRGFKNVYEMNEEIVKRHNEVVKPTDIVYFLGDAMFGNIDDSINYVRRLHGEFYAIIGNHDTDNKRALLRSLLPNWHEIGLANVTKENGLRFYLCHYPTITAEPIEQKQLRSRTLCLYGHTHQQTKFYDNKNPYIYNVGVDSHNCYPVSIEQIISDITKKEGNI